MSTRVFLRFRPLRIALVTLLVGVVGCGDVEKSPPDPGSQPPEPEASLSTSSTARSDFSGFSAPVWLPNGYEPCGLVTRTDGGPAEGVEEADLEPDYQGLVVWGDRSLRNPWSGPVAVVSESPDLEIAERLTDAVPTTVNGQPGFLGRKNRDGFLRGQGIVWQGSDRSYQIVVRNGALDSDLQGMAEAANVDAGSLRLAADALGPRTEPLYVGSERFSNPRTYHLIDYLSRSADAAPSARSAITISTTQGLSPDEVEFGRLTSKETFTVTTGDGVARVAAILDSFDDQLVAQVQLEAGYVATIDAAIEVLSRGDLVRLMESLRPITPTETDVLKENAARARSAFGPEVDADVKSICQQG